MPNLDWIGKKAVIRHHKEVPFRLLEPIPGLSCGEASGNLLVQGDNLDALKTLLPRYAGRIKCIYIDPPYNTGAKDWKYDNDYVDKNDTFRHSKWLSLMKKRLDIAKKLLAEDGVLICAIDENELHTLGLMLENIFGAAYEYHCVAIVHNPRGIQGKNFSYTNEFAIFVVPCGYKIIGDRKLSDSEIYWSALRNWGGESERTDAKNCFFPIIVKGDEIIGFGDVVHDENAHPKQNEVIDGLVYVYPVDIQGVERKWRYARQSIESVKQFLRVKKIRGRYDIEIGKTFGTYRTVWQDNRYDANEYGKQIINALVPGNPFDFPKSLWNVYDCLYAVIGTRPNATVLDFFAGSGTTAHAVMELNKNDIGNDGKRRFILATNNENGICRNVTYPRIVNAAKQNDYPAILKYYSIGFVPITERFYYEYADELLKYIRGLAELENGINFIGNGEIAVVLTDDELTEFISNIDGFKKCRILYLGHDVLTDGKQDALLKEKRIKINIIPDYYYQDLEGR
jgi:adenine-specific DNA-methyltransferase